MECRKGRGSGTGTGEERGHDGGAGCYEEESGGVDGEGDVMGMDVRGEEEAGDGCMMIPTLREIRGCLGQCHQL